jgi:hypothetical protein
LEKNVAKATKKTPKNLPTFHFTDFETKRHFLNRTEFSHDFLNGVALDLSFQRHACWPLKQMTEFCTSVMLGNAPSPIVVVNIEKSLEKTVKNSDDWKYFKKWKDLGYKWISIDGNNRTVSLKKFYNNEVPISHGKYLRSVVININHTNDTFAKIPDEIKQKAYEDSQITVVEYHVSSRQDCSDLFLNINSGRDLNAQEKRNAKLTDIAKEIRELGANSVEALKYIFNKGNEGYQIDEMIARMACIHAYGPKHGVSPKDLNESYEDNSIVWPQFISHGGKESIEKTIELIQKYSNQKFKNKATMLNLFMVVSTLHKQNRKIIDDELFFKWFIETEKNRLHKVAYQNRNGEKLLYETCNRNVNSINLTARFELILKDIETAPKNIVSDPLDNKRFYTKQEKYQAWLDQNGVCAITGKVIPEDVIINMIENWEEPTLEEGFTEIWRV